MGNLLDHNRAASIDAVHAQHPSMLAGLIWDGEGRRMVPNHANKRGVRYRYYASAKDKERLKLPIWRVPAGDLEGLVMRQLKKANGVENGISLSRQEIRSLVERVTLYKDRIEIALLRGDIAEPMVIPATLINRGGENRLSVPREFYGRTLPDPSLVKLIVKAFQVRELIEGESSAPLKSAASQMGLSTAYFGVLLRLSYLAPDIVAAILDGRQPTYLNRQRLARVTLPLDWQEQRTLLGFS